MPAESIIFQNVNSDFAHLDFTWSPVCKDCIYGEVVDLLKQYNPLYDESGCTNRALFGSVLDFFPPCNFTLMTSPYPLGEENATMLIEAIGGQKIIPFPPEVNACMTSSQVEFRFIYFDVSFFS